MSSPPAHLLRIAARAFGLLGRVREALVQLRDERLAVAEKRGLEPGEDERVRLGRARGVGVALAVVVGGLADLLQSPGRRSARPRAERHSGH